MTQSVNQPLESTRVAMIGLGLMGKPMARNLKAAGASMFVANRSQGVVQELAGEGMTPLGSGMEAAEKADIIILMLSDTLAVDAVITGEQGLLQTDLTGKLVIDMGTTEAGRTRELAALIKNKGAAFVDAPVSGGTIGAEAGSLSIMAGGSTEALARAMAVLDVLGSKIVHVGEAGAGQVAKAANQVIVGLTISAVAEALTLAERAGVDPAKVHEALSGGFADSRVLEVHGKRIIERQFVPGGKCTTQRKDLMQALKLASAYDLKLPTTAEVMTQYDRLIDAGHGDLDHSALAKVLDL